MITIGLVDDHQMFLDGMVSVFSTQSSFSILFVENNAKSALEKIKHSKPDIIISDISMPDINGIEFIKLVKENYPDIKVLVLSMFDNLQTTENMDGYLLKETDSCVHGCNTLVDSSPNWLTTRTATRLPAGKGMGWETKP